MCSHVFMCDRKDNKNINSQINSSIKYISNTHGGIMKNKIYRNEIMMNMYFRVCVWIFNR